jgi:glycosyltransferase involved in cell wall biosynthesis
MEKIIFLVPYPQSTAPSQRFRFEQYLPELQKEFEVEVHSFIDTETWEKLYAPGLFGFKIRKILGSFRRRLVLLGKIKKAEYIFIHREASQIGPPIFEWIIAKILRKKYIFDFDDATWLPNFSETSARFQRLKAYWKVKYIIKWAGKISAGNEYLADFARKYNSNVQIIPTTIDTENHHNLICNSQADLIRIGWTGSHTTMHYLDELLPVLHRLNDKHKFLFRVISNEKPNWDLPNLEFVKWNKTSEIEDLSQIQIGVMPLKSDIWSSGKCGFKALQYMSLEIPTVLSAVGVNTQIVTHEVDGYICTGEQEWFERLDQLISDHELRKQIGTAGRKRIKDAYSVVAQTSNYKKLFQS